MPHLSPMSWIISLMSMSMILLFLILITNETNSKTPKMGQLSSDTATSTWMWN